MKAKPAITLLVIIFVGPIILSWWFVNSDIDWTERGLSNHGVLIRPAVDLREREALNPLFEFASLAPSHWAIISLENAACAETCQARIDKLNAIHTVMGSSRDRLRVFAVAPAGAAEDTQSLLINPQTTSALSKAISSQIPATLLPQYVVVDWRRQLMMRFPPDTPPGDIKKDLSKLLRASKVR